MRTIATIAELRAVLDGARHDGRRVGLVPTMGYLHDGHASLMERARAECNVVASTIFVNPLQFAAHEDLDSYPRDLDRDQAIAARAGVDVLFTPALEEMYPATVLTAVSVAGVADDLEGATRPTHFAGVATVVAKLFNIAGPCHAYFGEKDYQQLLVVRQMARDLSFPVEVVGCPTVREIDGLALSSRNKYLDADERAAAPVLYRALQAGAAAIAAGERDRAVVADLVASIVAAEPLARLDYAAVRAADDLAEISPLVGKVRLLVAANFGGARLIDNLGVTAL